MRRAPHAAHWSAREVGMAAYGLRWTTDTQFFVAVALDVLARSAGAGAVRRLTADHGRGRRRVRWRWRRRWRRRWRWRRWRRRRWRRRRLAPWQRGPRNGADGRHRPRRESEGAAPGGQSCDWDRWNRWDASASRSPSSSAVTRRHPLRNPLCLLGLLNDSRDGPSPNCSRHRHLSVHRGHRRADSTIVSSVTESVSTTTSAANCTS